MADEQLALPPPPNPQAENSKPPPEITPKQKAFVREYLKDLNATQAAERAGYSKKTARSSAARLLTKENIQHFVALGAKKISDKLEVQIDDILRETMLIAHSDIGEIIDFSGDEPRLRPANQISERARRSISSFKVKRYMEKRGDDKLEVEITEFKLWSKVEALALLGKYRKLWSDRLEIVGDPSKPITFAIVGRDTWRMGDADGEGGGTPTKIVDVKKTESA